MKDDDKALVPVQQGIVAAVNSQLAIMEKLLAHRRGRQLSNSIGMKFVLIPAGTFMMGSPEYEEGRRPNEVLHQVTLSRPFYIQTTEVTQLQWQLIMANNPSFSQEEAIEQYGSSEDCPVEKVSWYDAQQFIGRLNDREETNKYRLPTEAEWEYACRAGSTTRYYFGDDESRLREHAWYGDLKAKWSPDRPMLIAHPVGQKKPNAWGLYDMHGNVWEWCQDWYDDDYPELDVTDPSGPPASRMRIGRLVDSMAASELRDDTPLYGPRAGVPPTGQERVVRGGSYFDSRPMHIRSACRSSSAPDYKCFSIGFRLARDL